VKILESRGVPFEGENFSGRTTLTSRMLYSLG
jgi:hypothetical protein